MLLDFPRVTKMINFDICITIAIKYGKIQLTTHVNTYIKNNLSITIIDDGNIWLFFNIVFFVGKKDVYKNFNECKLQICLVAKKKNVFFSSHSHFKNSIVL